MVILNWEIDWSLTSLFVCPYIFKIISNLNNISKNRLKRLVSMNSNPKVCKIMDYGKFRFEQAKKEKEARKKSKGIETKEIRITPNIDTHDFEFKCKNAEKFLKDGNKVKITVRFRGREMNYVKLGENVLNKFMESLKDISNLEKKPLLEGKNMFIILSPKPSK